MYAAKLYFYAQQNMIQKEIYIIRHGQTDHNAKGIVQGKGINLSLNEKGRTQSEAFFAAYQQIPFEIIYTSTLTRAQESVASFMQLGIAHQIFSELDEISWGEMEGAVSTQETSESFQALLAKWKAGDIYAKPGDTGESPFDLQQRQKRFVEHLVATTHSKILIATHGRFIRAFMCTLTGAPLSEMDNFHHVNLCLYKVNLHGNGKFEIELNCEQSHLEGLQ